MRLARCRSGSLAANRAALANQSTAWAGFPRSPATKPAEVYISTSVTSVFSLAARASSARASATWRSVAWRIATSGEAIARKITSSATALLSPATSGRLLHQRHTRPTGPMGRARIGSPFKNRCKSSASSAADAYRRCRSSPGTSGRSSPGRAAHWGSVARGETGSCSRLGAACPADWPPETAVGRSAGSTGSRPENRHRRPGRLVRSCPAACSGGM